MSSHWRLKPKFPESMKKDFPAYSEIVLQLLYDRGLDSEEKIEEFFKPDFTQDVHDPFLFADMKKAVEHINQAIKNQAKILIYGDYDADGVTATVLMEKTLRKLGAENVSIYIPHRDIEGYGINKKIIKQILADRISLIITVDCGITDIEAVKELRDKAIKVIITDHHLPGEKLPEAEAILDCSLEREKYPFKKLAGVGMAFKLSQALFISQSDKEKYVAFEKWLLDLVALGTIGDMSPILGENRTLVAYGLKVLNKTPRQGLQELIRISSLSDGEELKDLPLGSVLYDLDVRNISFQLVPRINAAGRMAHANLAYNLLTTDDELEAIALARDIQEKNTLRQKTVEEIFQQAIVQIENEGLEKKIFIALNDSWSAGLVGLVAGKLKDKYNRPVMLFSCDKEKYVGSARSISEFNITEAMSQVKDFLFKFGGHAQAGGLTIVGQENFRKFKVAMESLAEKKLAKKDLSPTIAVDVEVPLKALDWQLIDDLKKFEPFAEANPAPLFWVKNLLIEDLSVMGKDGQHLRLMVRQGSLLRKAVSFGTAEEWQLKIKKGDRVEAVVELGVNEWNGNRELQLKLLDIKKIF